MTMNLGLSSLLIRKIIYGQNLNKQQW